MRPSTSFESLAERNHQTYERCSQAHPLKSKYNQRITSMSTHKGKNCSISKQGLLVQRHSENKQELQNWTIKKIIEKTPQQIPLGGVSSMHVQIML